MSCVHLSDYKSKFGVESYKTINEVFVSNSLLSNSPKKIWVCCFSCGDEFSRLLACLHCVYIGCYKTHISAHNHQNGHKLYVEVANGCIFCTVCKDYVYDPEFENVMKQKYSKAKNTSSVCKWRPTESEEVILKKHKSYIKILPPPKGIRGMINLGNTCFMNCIMQALLHTPMLRDYFFADKHVCHAPKSSDCLVCLFIRLFQKYYTDEQSSLCLHEILYLLWQNARHLSGYGQKDAHEFFMVALNLLHQNSVPKNSSTEACSCIIDVIFHGKMQSDLVCQSCSNISTKVDPIRDIPLDIPDPPAPANLYECLNHFMRAEPLASEINCSTCNSYQKVTKQLTLNTLPLVIVIQLKRFEFDDSGNKKNTFVSFPVELDMSSFMPGHRNNSSTEDNSVDLLKLSCDNRYSLYAAIEHLGTLDNGHYLAYIRKSTDVWFKCSDDRVDRAKIEDVMSCEGYLLFYHKTVLNYA